MRRLVGIYDGINVDAMHAGRTREQRENVVKSFRRGTVWVLICTELMGRGVDFKGVNLVVNYDLPPTSISYIHRVGRTGRAGQRGRAVTFYTQEESFMLRSIASVVKQAGCDVPDYMLQLKKVSKRKRRKLASSILHREHILTAPPSRRGSARRENESEQLAVNEDG